MGRDNLRVGTVMRNFLLVCCLLFPAAASAQTPTTFSTGTYTSAPNVNSAFGGKADLGVTFNLGFGGVPGASWIAQATLTYACTVPANFAGSSGWIGTTATGSPAFALALIHSGSPTTIGNVTASAHAPVYPSYASISAVAGDTWQLTAPASPDATLADIVLGIACNRN